LNNGIILYNGVQSFSFRDGSKAEALDSSVHQLEQSLEKLSMQKDYYKILGIPKNTESAQIKQKAQNVLDKAAKEYETLLTEMKKAYSIIADPVNRQDYDRKLKAEPRRHTNFYQILRIAPYTNQRLVKELTQNTVNTVKKEYKSKIAEMREAYSVLGNTQEKADYDNTRLQEEKERETKRRQRQAKRKKTQRRFSLRKLFFPVLVIGLMYFGYTQYQSVPYSADEEFQGQKEPLNSNSWEEDQPTIHQNSGEEPEVLLP
jgi:curved DNA-binding protein CbpA